jgi:hypothetical protein
MSEDGLLGKLASVAAMDAPRLEAAERTAGVWSGGRGPQGEGDAVKIRARQSAAQRHGEKLSQEQERPPTPGQTWMKLAR